VARSKLEPAREGDWTVRRMMEEHALTETQARRVLEKLAASGLVEKVKVLNPNPNGGGSCLAYRPVERKKK
jgi:predicted transcriptional regulator